MIKFEHNNGDLRTAVFGGSMDDILADLCMEVALIYGAMSHTDKKLAKAFKESVILFAVNRELQDSVFTTELYDAITKSGHYEHGTMVVDNEELARQLKELLDEDK